MRALEAWGYGRPLPSCAGADVCVIAGTRHHAGPVGQRCIAEVATPVRWETVAHELGHCFGLPHSDNELSVMYPRYLPGMSVLEEDRGMLQ